MTDAKCRAAAKQFAADWQGRGDEKQDTSLFWIALLQKNRTRIHTRMSPKNSKTGWHSKRAPPCQNR